MRTARFVRNLKYDAVPRTTVLIEQFISVVAVTFDTMHTTKFSICELCGVCSYDPEGLSASNAAPVSDQG